MSIIERISLAIKSYLNATSSRMERVAAEEELRLAKARREAAEELGKSVEIRTGRTVPASDGPIVRRQVTPKLASDYRLLGVPVGADLDSVEAAWRKLASRADPKRFPAGSEEEKRAADILNSINEAYAGIREALNPTEGRFGRLEL
ncbi:MAG: J domain-containing protein [Armatimonadetes bacterium]|nr:J domain-containing protein [Armatimonadota bacterium]